MNDTVGLLESVEVGDAQSPRPCGHALFLCLAVKQPRVVSSAVLTYAQELQQRQPGNSTRNLPLLVPSRPSLIDCL